MDTKLIFLTTPMRSGSTLLSRMLSAHPEVEMSYDSVNFFRFCYRKYDPITAEGNLERLFRDMSHRLVNRFGIQLDATECMRRMQGSAVSYGAAYLAILRSLFPKQRKRILGDKESMAWTKIPAFLEMFPEGRAIVIVRDPRDVVNSFRKTTIAPGNDYLIALFDVVDAVNHAVRHSTRDPQRVHMVKFERLKLDPTTELGALCGFLGIDPVPEMTDLERFTDHAGNKWDAAESLSFPDEKDPLAPVGRWKKQLCGDDLFLCEWIAGQQIRMLGLTPSGRTPSQREFDSALSKVMSSQLLREAFKRWCETGEGSERFPLDPTNPANWDPNWIRNPEAFLPKSHAGVSSER
jgi:hypothetical protein